MQICGAFLVRNQRKLLTPPPLTSLEGASGLFCLAKPLWKAELFDIPFTETTDTGQRFCLAKTAVSLRQPPFWSAGHHCLSSFTDAFLPNPRAHGIYCPPPGGGRWGLSVGRRFDVSIFAGTLDLKNPESLFSIPGRILAFLLAQQTRKLPSPE